VERPGDASGRVFRHGRQAVYMLVRRAAESAGVALTPKMLRKFFITRMKMARVRDLHPAAWDSMVEHMAEHAISRVQRAYFILSPEELERHYVENYGAIEVGLPAEEYAAAQATENSQP
jgi:integrase